MSLVSGWGRYPQIEAEVLKPRCLAQLRAGLSQAPRLARGFGRSYGDSALNAQISELTGLNHFLSFDAEKGLLACQAGVSLADILKVIVPRGWFLPITPGTQWVSVGGAIASDVHGKNHHNQGCFSECVQSIGLLLADGSFVRCSRIKHPALFYATCAGMGLTGMIVNATLQLMPIKSSEITQYTFKAHNLDEALALLDQYHHTRYSVAWIDCLAQGKDLGRALLMIGDHAEEGPLSVPTKEALNVPFEAPDALLNRFSMQAFNSLYYRRIRGPQRVQQLSYERFFYPLDNLNNWNLLYGKQGFIQYQCVLPNATAAEGLREILTRVSVSKRGSFLAVLKAMGAANHNFLSFPLAGYTLALDFKFTPDLLPLLDELDALVLEYGGRLYLAKDARMSEATFKQSYPNWEAFNQVRAEYGALGAFCSLQSQRLGL